MSKTPGLIAATFLVVTLGSAVEAAAQCCWPRPPRPPRTVPEDLQPAVGIVLGPSSRAAEKATGGFQLGLTGEVPLPEGFLGRAELGVAAWNTDPMSDGGATFLSIRHATLGLYRMNGERGVHTFIGGGVGLYRFRVQDAGGSGTKPGIHAGVGIEGGGKRLAISGEMRLTIAGGGRPNPGQVYEPSAHESILHASILFGVKRRF